MSTNWRWMSPGHRPVGRQWEHRRRFCFSAGGRFGLGPNQLTIAVARLGRRERASKPCLPGMDVTAIRPPSSVLSGSPTHLCGVGAYTAYQRPMV